MKKSSDVAEKMKKERKSEETEANWGYWKTVVRHHMFGKGGGTEE